MATPRDPVVARIRGLAAAALAVLGLVTLAACGGSGGSGAQSITLYNGQHVQTTQTWSTAFEKATGITVNVRSDDEDTLADQIVDRGLALPRRRVLHRELAGRSSACRPRGCWPR